MNWVNGVPQEQISVNDRGLLYGDGVFTTLRVHAEKPLLLDQHLRRIHRDCDRLAIPRPDQETLGSEIHAASQGVERGIVKVIVTRGAGGRGYRIPHDIVPTRIVQRHVWPDFSADFWSDGVRLKICATTLSENEVLAGVKHLNRLEQVLARSEWSGTDFQDGIVCARSGAIIETTSANLFLVTGQALVTPALTHCGVRGVVRHTVIELARGLGLPVEERDVAAEEIRRADEIFITNSVIGVWPVREVESTRLRNHEITRRLMRALIEFEPGYA